MLYQIKTVKFTDEIKVPAVGLRKGLATSDHLKVNVTWDVDRGFLTISDNLGLHNKSIVPFHRVIFLEPFTEQELEQKQAQDAKLAEQVARQRELDQRAAAEALLRRQEQLQQELDRLQSPDVERIPSPPPPPKRRANRGFVNEESE